MCWEKVIKKSLKNTISVYSVIYLCFNIKLDNKNIVKNKCFNNGTIINYYASVPRSWWRAKCCLSKRKRYIKIYYFFSLFIESFLLNFPKILRKNDFSFKIFFWKKKIVYLIIETNPNKEVFLWKKKLWASYTKSSLRQ